MSVIRKGFVGTIDYFGKETSYTITFDVVRGKIRNMTSLPENEIIEIMLKVDELERIVQSSKNKSQKWDSGKAIIKWVTDRGFDVGITLIPLLMQI